jgi:hypothetical protein
MKVLWRLLLPLPGVLLLSSCSDLSTTEPELDLSPAFATWSDWVDDSAVGTEVWVGESSEEVPWVEGAEADVGKYRCPNYIGLGSFEWRMRYWFDAGPWYAAGPRPFTTLPPAKGHFKTKSSGPWTSRDGQAEVRGPLDAPSVSCTTRVVGALRVAGLTTLYAYSGGMIGFPYVRGQFREKLDDSCGQEPASAFNTAAMTASYTTSSASECDDSGPGGGPGGGGEDGGTMTCYTLTRDHYWYYPDTGEIEYRYTETYTWCEMN